MSEININTSAKLTEAQEYYIGLFEKWQKMSKDENVKKENPELWEELNKTNFNDAFNFYKNKCKLYINEQTKEKKISFEYYSKDLSIFNKLIILAYLDKDLNNLKLFLGKIGGTKRTVFSMLSIEAADYFGEMIQSKKLDAGEFKVGVALNLFIDATTSALKNHRIMELKKQITTSKSSQPSEIFDFTENIPKEYWEPFATYFSGFKSFIKRAKGKNLGMELNVNGDFVFRVYSDNSKDLEGIQQDLNDFLSAIAYYGQNKFENYQKIQSGENVSINNLIVEGKVNQLIQEVKYLELENKTLRTANSLFSIILPGIEEGISQNLLENRKLLETTRPTIYTEGKIDVQYLKTAIEVLGFDQLSHVEIEEIGHDDGKGGQNGGCSNLDNYLNANKYKTSKLGNKVVLLYDCDTNKPNQNIEDKLFVHLIPFNSNNQKYKIGIENLLLEKYFLDDNFYKTSIKNQEKVGKIIEIKTIELDKNKLYKYICDKREISDFEIFRPLLESLISIIL
jgi:hypothetical protein